MMDFHSMKRKRLQSLCKKHGIPANLKNKEMAHRLSFIFKGKENVVSSGSDNAGSEKDMLDVQTGELNSSNCNNLKMVALDMVTGNLDALEEKLVGSRKRSLSPNLEERVGFSSKLLKTSEVERLESDLNLSLEKTRADIGICDLEGNTESETSKGQVDVDDCEEGLHSEPGMAVMKHVDPLPAQVALEEFDDHLVEAEVEKLCDHTDVEDDNGCGTEKNEAEAEKRDNTNPQEPNRNYVDILLASSEENGYPLFEGEVKKSNENTCVHGSVYNIMDREQVDDSVMNDGDLEQVASDEYDNYTVEGEGEKLVEKTDAHEDVCGTSEGGAEDEKQDDGSSFQISNVDDLNLLQIPLLESCYTLVEEAHNSDVGVYNVRNGGSEDNNAMYLDTSIGAKDTDGKANVTAEHFQDEIHLSNCKDSNGTPVHFLPNYPPSNVKSSDLNIHQMVVSGTATGNAAELKTVSSPKIISTPDSETKGLVSGMNLSPETPRDDIGLCNVEENKQEKVNDSQDVLHAASSTMVDLVPCQKSDVTICVDGAVYNSGNSGSEGDNMYLLVTSIATKDTDGKTNVAMEHFQNEVHSSSSKYSDDAPDQFMTTCPLSEVKSSDLNIHEMVASDTCEEKLESPQKEGLVADPKECIGFCSKHLEASETEGFEGETNFDPSTLGGTVGLRTYIMEKSMQSVKTDLAAHADQCIEFSPKHLDASMIKFLEAETDFNPSTVGDTLGICSMEENLQSAQNEKVEYSEEALHTTMDAVVINDVDLLQKSMEEWNLVQGDFSILFDNSDAQDDANGTGAEDESQSYMVNPKREKRDKDNASDQNPDETLDEFVHSMPQPDQNNSCTFDIHQMFASDTASGDEDTCQEKLESPPKCTPIASSEETISFFPKLLESSTKKRELEIETNFPLKSTSDTLGTSVMKENVNTAKKDQVSTVISKKTFSKRQPLQDLQQN